MQKTASRVMAAQPADGLDSAADGSRESDPDQQGASIWNTVGAGWLLFSLLLVAWLVLGRLHGYLFPSRTVGLEHRSAATQAQERYKFQLDINQATSAQLQALPDIGTQLASRIVEYRETHGPFVSLADLLDVRGVGPTTLQRLQPMLTVSRPDPVDVQPADSLISGSQTAHN